MKQIVGNGTETYSFVAATRTVTITGLQLTVESLLLINNPTRETIIYNPFESGKGYTSFSTNTNGTTITTTIVLEYDTTSFSDSDKLQIFYDNSNLANEYIADLALQIKKLFYKLDMMGVNASVALGNESYQSTRPRLQAMINSIDSSLGAVTSLGVLTNIGRNSRDFEDAIVPPLMTMTFADKVRSRIT